MFGNSKKRIRRKIEESFGKLPTSYEGEQILGRMDAIKLYHKEMCDRGRCGDIDEITWNDLEMDQVFLRVDHTNSYIGEQILYHRLHDTRRDDDTAWEGWERLEQQIAFYENNPQARIDIEERLSLIGKSDQDYYLPSFLMNAELWSIRGGTILHVLQLLLLVFFAGALFTEEILFVAGLAAVACVNLVIYIAAKQKYEVFMYSLNSLKQLLLFSQRVTREYRDELAVPEEIALTAEELKGLSKQIIGWQGRKYAVLTGDIMYLLQDYLFGITLLDLSMFNHIMKIIDGKQKQILKLYEFAGEVDMGIAAASFRRSLSYYCQPNVWEQKEFQVKGLVHPLLQNAVANDFRLKNRAVVTGANASGKSTFMKALAVNVILAQTIHTCTAAEFSMPAVSVMTSMALRDDLKSGESYYIREAKRMKQMVDSKQNDRPLLIVIDEILKGTNTAERLAASSAILEYFTRLPHYVVVATHDTGLVNEMRSKYDSFYFESRVAGDDIVFEYRIHSGKGGNSNAIALLSLLGYPQEIVHSANERIRAFASDGCMDGRKVGQAS